MKRLISREEKPWSFETKEVEIEILFSITAHIDVWFVKFAE